VNTITVVLILGALLGYASSLGGGESNGATDYTFSASLGTAPEYKHAKAGMAVLICDGGPGTAWDHDFDLTAE
jgi:hypothetical protein